MKRFYKTATAVQIGGGWQVQLDGRGILTAGKRPQVVGTEALARAMAAEWDSQGAEIDTAGFILRDLADFAIDVVADDPGQTIRELLPYVETDTLCYRAEDGDPLLRRQLAAWEPLLVAAEARWDVHFQRIGGIIHAPQPCATIARMEAVLAAEDPFRLAALKTLANLAASLVIGLAALQPGAEAEDLWNTANLEEDWQAERWGKDAEAEARRARRFADFAAAMRFAALARQAPA